MSDVRVHHYNRRGDRIPRAEWMALLEQDGYRVIAFTEDGDWAVSTLWLGVDVGTLGAGPPLIFETMVFAYRSWMDRWQIRYATEDAAREGHDRMVSLVRWETDMGNMGKVDNGARPTAEDEREWLHSNGFLSVRWEEK